MQVEALNLYTILMHIKMSTNIIRVCFVCLF